MGDLRYSHRIATTCAICNAYKQTLGGKYFKAPKFPV